MKKSILLLLMITILLGACGRSPDAKFYSLSSIPASPSRSHGIGLGVGPVTIAKYLQQPQIITRQSANQLELSEFHRWAAPLKDNINTVLVSDLQVMLNSNNVYLYPNRENVPMKMQVSVNISEFDTRNDGISSLRSHWQLFSLPSKCLIISKTTNYQTSISGKISYDKIVAAMSQNLKNLSADIAQQVKASARKYGHCRSS